MLVDAGRALERTTCMQCRCMLGRNEIVFSPVSPTGESTVDDDAVLCLACLRRATLGMDEQRAPVLSPLAAEVKP